MKKLLILSTIFLLHSCDQRKGPYLKSRSIITDIVESDSSEIPESVRLSSSEYEQGLENKVQLIKDLIINYGIPATEQFQIERIKTQAPESNKDSVEYVIVHISFGLQKEVPIPNAIVNFTYLDQERNLLLQKIEILSLTRKTQDTSQAQSLPEIEYKDVIEMSVRHESGFKNRPFQRFDYTSHAVQEKRNPEVLQLFHLLNSANIDSSFTSTDIPRTIGNPEIGVAFFKIRNDSKEWMVYNILTEEPGYLEPTSDWIYIRRFEFVNQAETYLIKKESHKELDEVIKELIKEKNAT